MSDITTTDYNDFFLDFEQRASGEVKKDEKSEDKKFVLLKVLVILLASALLLEGIIYTFVHPLFNRPAVIYSGLSSVTKEQLAQKLSPLSSSTWSSFNIEKAVTLVSEISCVESVSIDKQFPDKIYIKIKERTPVARSIVSIDGASKSIQIDENGVLFSLQSDAYLGDSSVPLVSGIPLENLKDGMRLPAKYRPLMDQISSIRKLPQKYFAAISEIQVLPKEYGNFELAIYPVSTRARVLTDRSLNEDALKYMMVVLDVVNSIEPDAQEIDLRYGSVSYRRR